MKKYAKTALSLFLSAFLFLSALPLFSAAAEIVDSGVFGEEGDNLTWTLDGDGLLTVDGEGAMATYPAPWREYHEQIKAVRIGNGVTTIGESAFSSCYYLTEVTIPDSVQRIEYRAFENCAYLTQIHIPGSVDEICEGAFSNCTRLTSVTIEDGVRSIGMYAFAKAGSYVDIEMPGDPLDAVETSDLVFPPSVQEIGEGAFLQCYRIKKIVFEGPMIGIHERAFERCLNLETLSLPGVVECGEDAFYGCKRLKSIRFAAWEHVEEVDLEYYGAIAGDSSSEEGTHVPVFTDCGAIETVSVPFYFLCYDNVFSGAGEIRELIVRAPACAGPALQTNAFEIGETGNEALLAASVTYTSEHFAPVESETVVREATCGRAGEKTVTKTCSVCGEVLHEETVSVPATGEHAWGEWSVTREPTVQSAGEKTRVCGVCGETQTEAIEPLDPGDAPQDQPVDPQPGKDDPCPYCGGDHTGFFGPLVRFFHQILWFFARLFGKM